MTEKQDISSQFGGTLDAPMGSGKHGRHGKRFWIILAAWIVLVIGCGLGGWYYMSHLSSAQKPAIKATTTTVVDKGTDIASLYPAVNNAAAAKKASGDIKGAADIYQAAAATETTATGKAYLYSSASSLYYNAGQYQGALQPAIDTYTANPSEGSAELVADIYIKLGNKDQAIVYFQKAIALVDPNDPASYGTDYFQAQIDSLK